MLDKNLVLCEYDQNDIGFYSHVLKTIPKVTESGRLHVMLRLVQIRQTDRR